MSHNKGRHKKQNKAKNPPPVTTPVVERNEQAAPKTDATTANTEQKIPQASAPKPTSWDKWTCRATVVMAIATIFYTSFAGWQLRTMQRQLDQMQEASQLDSRAWVGVYKGDPKPLAVGKPVECQIEFTNTGKTPALDVRAQHTLGGQSPSCDIEVIALSYEDQERYPPKSQGAVPPNGTIAVCSHSSNIASTQMLKDIMDGRQTVYVFGSVSYRDIFGIQHKTRYCYTIDPNTNELKAHRQYNYMD